MNQIKELQRLIRAADSVNDPDLKREFLEYIVSTLQGLMPGKVIESRTFPAGRGQIASFAIVRTEDKKKKFRRSKDRVCIWRVKAKNKGQEDVSLVRSKDKEGNWRNTLYPLGVSLSREELLNVWAATTIQLFHNQLPKRVFGYVGKEYQNSLSRQKERLEKAVNKATSPAVNRSKPRGKSPL